jgi:flagellar basal-body rod protein FlgB
MLDRLLNSGAMPALERMLQFTTARQQVLADDIANLSTPYFKPRDLSPRDFQKALGKAIDRRRRNGNPEAGPLEIQDTRQLSFASDHLEIKPEALNENVLFHDQNNRDLDRTMQRLAENSLANNAAVELMRNEMSLLQTAISERV